MQDAPSPLHEACDFENPIGQPIDCKDHAEQATMVPREGFLGVCRLMDEQFPTQYPGEFQYRILQGLTDMRYYLQVDNYRNFTMGIMHFIPTDPRLPFFRWDAADSNTSLIRLPEEFSEIDFKMYDLPLETAGTFTGAEVRPLWSDYLGQPWLTYEVQVGGNVSYASGMRLWVTGHAELYRSGSVYHEDGDDKLSILWRSPGGVGIGSAALGGFC